MTTEAWHDMSYDGKQLRKYLRRLYKAIDKESKKANPDWDKLNVRIEVAARVAKAQKIIVNFSNVQERLENIEKLMDHMKPSELAELKARAGI